VIRLIQHKHLFYPSTAEAEAEAANAKEDSHNGGGGGGDKPRRPSRIERLRRLPEPIVRFQQFPPANDVDVNVDGHEIFVLLSPRGRIFHASQEGHAVLFDVGDDSTGSISTLPSLDGANGFTPIAMSHPHRY
jgi:hypothetical protein